MLRSQRIQPNPFSLFEYRKSRWQRPFGWPFLSQEERAQGIIIDHLRANYPWDNETITQASGFSFRTSAIAICKLQKVSFGIMTKTATCFCHLHNCINLWGTNRPVFWIPSLTKWIEWISILLNVVVFNTRGCKQVQTGLLLRIIIIGDWPLAHYTLF